jgi:hypothetical protein
MVLEKLERAKEAAAAYVKAADLDGALKPLVDEALARLGLGPSSAGAGGAARKAPEKLWLLGGALVFALGLLFMGMKRAVKPEWATPATPPAPKTPTTPVR